MVLPNRIPPGCTVVPITSLLPLVEKKDSLSVRAIIVEFTPGGLRETKLLLLSFVNGTGEDTLPVEVERNKVCFTILCFMASKSARKLNIAEIALFPPCCCCEEEEEEGVEEDEGFVVWCKKAVEEVDDDEEEEDALFKDFVTIEGD
jgi:hypothetical protein